jgi:hypothetical protein
MKEVRNVKLSAIKEATISEPIPVEGVKEEIVDVVPEEVKA